MSCCPVTGGPSKDSAPHVLATKKASICSLCASEISATNISTTNLDVDTINGAPVSSSSCTCETSTYTPNVISFLGFSSGVTPLPALITRINNIVTITGIVVATNTLPNNWATAELSLPLAFPVGGTAFARGSGAYWNNDVDVLTGVVVPVHIIQQTATTFRLSVNQLTSDGSMTYTLQYEM